MTASGQTCAPPADDLHTILLGSPMSRVQWTAVIVAVALYAMDGFDVLAITFAAPAIAKGWGMGKGALGVVFSSGLLGMAAGAFFLSPIADRIGRRPVVLGTLAMMIVGTAWTANADDISALLASRVFTGVGVGGMVAVVNPLTAEYPNAQRRNIVASLINVGYPLGGVIGGFLAAQLLPHYGWRAIFEVASLLGTALLLVAWLALPEPASTIVARGPPDALAKVNIYLKRCGLRPVTSLPEGSFRTGLPTAALFRSGMTSVTLRVTAIYFLFVVTLFYLQNWVPTLVTDLGFTASVAASVSVWLSIGGILGGLAVGALATRIGLKSATLVALFVAAFFAALFGVAPADILLLKVAAAFAGFAVYAGIVGIYAVVSRSFPVAMRASGAGFVIGIGRLGSVASPLIASALFAVGIGRVGVSAALAAPALLAALILLILPVRPAEVL